MKSTIIRFIIIALLLPVTVAAFDGARKGFVLGGGLGLAPTAGWKVDTNFDFFGATANVAVDENKAGLGLNFIIGYAWDEHNMIVYEGNVAAYSSDFFPNPSTGAKDQTIGQGFNGAAWYHYYGPVGKSFFTVAGLGFYVFDVGDYDANDAGGAMMLGGGYEFARHFQVGGYLAFGKTFDSGIDFEHSHINFLVSALAF